MFLQTPLTQEYSWKLLNIHFSQKKWKQNIFKSNWMRSSDLRPICLCKHFWLPSSYLKGHEELCTVSEWWIPFSYSTVLSDSLKGLWMRSDMLVSLKPHRSPKWNESSLSSALHELEFWLQIRSQCFSEKCWKNLQVQAQQIFWGSV